MSHNLRRSQYEKQPNLPRRLLSFGHQAPLVEDKTFRQEVTATNLPVPEVIHDSETLSNAMVGPEPEPPDNSTAETLSIQPDSPGSVSNAQNLNPGERAQPRYSYMRPRLGELEEQNFFAKRHKIECKAN